MADSEKPEPRAFKTLRGFLRGEEPDEPISFAYSATLRIFGDIADLDVISRRLDLTPTLSYRRGERKGPRSPAYKREMRAYRPAMPESEELHVHIDELWRAIKPHKDYLPELKKTLTVDVFLGYRSNCDHAGVEVPASSLEIFVELQIPFGLSIIVA